MIRGVKRDSLIFGSHGKFMQIWFGRSYQEGNSSYFSMAADIGVGTASGLVRSMATTPATVNDVTMAGRCCVGMRRRRLPVPVPRRAQAARGRRADPAPGHAPGQRRKLNPFMEPDLAAEPLEKLKVGIPDKSEQQFGFTKLRSRGVANLRMALGPSIRARR